MRINQTKFEAVAQGLAAG